MSSPRHLRWGRGIGLISSSPLKILPSIESPVTHTTNVAGRLWIHTIFPAAQEVQIHVKRISQLPRRLWRGIIVCMYAMEAA